MGSVIGYQEAHGPVATFETDVAGKIRKLEASIEPVQDLHGYDHPWPAGGGKNLANLDVQFPATQNGVTFVQNDDGSITINGTASANVSFILMTEKSITNGAFTISGVPVNTAGDSFRIWARNTIGGSEYNSTRNGISGTVNISTGTIYIYCTIDSGVSVNNVTVYLQLESGSTATVYSPYSNICPITGWTGAKVTKCGKNLFDETEALSTKSSDQYAVLEDGLIHYKNDGSSWMFTNTVSVFLKAGVYTLTLQNYRLVSGATPLWIIKVDGNTLYPSTSTGYQLNITKDTTVEIRITTPGTTSATEFYGNIQLELGSTATEYEPYVGSTYDITFPSAAGTVYGGKLDVVKGELVVDRAVKMYNGASSENWYKSNYGYFATSKINDAIDRNANRKDFQSNKYVYGNIANGTETLGGCLIWAAVRVRVSDMSISLDEWKSQLSAEPLQVVYTLATPITYQLTPQEISTIIGTNTIYADTGDTSVIYPKTITPIETVSNVSLMELRRNIIAAQGNDNLYDKWIWKQEKNDFVIRNNTVGFIEGLGNNIYIDQRSDRENNRRSIVVKRGMVPFVSYDSVSGGTYAPVKMYPIPIPPDAIGVQMSSDTQDIEWGGLVLRLENGVYREVEHSTTYTALGKRQWLITGENHFIAPYILRSDRGDFTEELENVRFTFTRDGQWRWTLTDSDLVMFSRSIAWDSANSRITYSASGVNNYKGVMVPDGLCGYYTNGALTTAAPIPVPPTATKVTVTTTPALQAQMILLKAADDQTQQLITNNGWNATPAVMTFTADDNLELAVALRVNSSAAAFTTSTTPTEIIIQFE